MKKAFGVLFNLAAFCALPGMAGAAGTYYNNNAFQRYGTNNSGYNASSRSYASRYGQQQTTISNTQTTTRTMARAGGVKQVANNNSGKRGWFLGAGLSHEFANWGFDMNNAGSKLHYDNLAWNVLDGNATYYFGDTTPMQIKLGARYGVQFGETPMIDDDISNGGYLVTTWTDGGTSVLGYQTGHALSVGTSKGGSQYGFNAALGLTDFFQWGRVKLTPSIGYRYLQYKLTTENNYGVNIDIFEATSNHVGYVNCAYGEMGELQCDPFMAWYGAIPETNPVEYGYTITGRLDDGRLGLWVALPDSGVMYDVQGIDPGQTYYYAQPGVSHEYTTTWAGPYLALDAEYNIDNKNVVVGGVELGLPYYTSEGNQPYRVDWLHPKSVEDTGGLGDAIHVGLNGTWKTLISDATMLTFGFTYDYYKVSKATAKTYMNSTYYTGLYNSYTSVLDNPPEGGWTPAEEAALNLAIDSIASSIAEYNAAGWVLESANEIKSIYKSMGLRLGFEVKF